jgi:hypothetical protein
MLLLSEQIASSLSYFKAYYVQPDITYIVVSIDVLSLSSYTITQMAMNIATHNLNHRPINAVIQKFQHFLLRDTSDNVIYDCLRVLSFIFRASLFGAVLHHRKC